MYLENDDAIFQNFKAAQNGRVRAMLACLETALKIPGDGFEIQVLRPLWGVMAPSANDSHLHMRAVRIRQAVDVAALSDIV